MVETVLPEAGLLPADTFLEMTWIVLFSPATTPIA